MMKKTILTLALSATASIYAVSAMAQEGVAPKTPEELAMEQTIANMSLASDVDGVANLLGRMAASGSPLLENAVKFASQVMPNSMATVIQKIQANFPSVSNTVVAGIVATSAITINQTNPAAAQALVNANAQVLAAAGVDAGNILPAAGPTNTPDAPVIEDNTLTPVDTTTPTENPSQLSSDQ